MNPQSRSSIPMRVLREPLLHFMLAGIALFVAFEWIGYDDAARSDEIRIDQTTLARFLTHRDPRLNLDSAAATLATTTTAQRELLIEEYVREEVLFRQAQAMGLDAYDYVGRRRLIAQLDYINRGFIEATLEFTDAELRAFHEANSERYLVPPKITFTHVFFSAASRGENAKALALRTLKELNGDRVPFHIGPSRGDVFHFHRNYVAKEAEEVASHFGADFAAAVFEQPPSDHWTGPIASEYGHHLVMVSSREPGFAPPLAEVRQRVAQDLASEYTHAELDAYYRNARKAYDIVIDLPETTP